MNSFIFNTFLLLLSLYFLMSAAKWMLDGAIIIAKRFNLSPLIIGSTIVAFGTILPSIAVNLAVIIFTPSEISLAVGNMLGTNYVNLGLALGIPAFITTIITKYNVFEKEIPLYLGLSGVFTVFAMNSEISKLEGLSILIAYIFISIIVFQYAKREKTEGAITYEEVEIKEKSSRSDALSLVKIIVGVVVLIISSFTLTFSAPIVAKYIGISPYIVGLTIVGIGTSIPTIVASIEAAKKNYIDIILGNVFGGNVINIGLGIGLPALFHTIKLNNVALQDIYFTNIYNFIIVILILIEMKLLGGNKAMSKISGLIIIIIYFGYLSYLVLK